MSKITILFIVTYFCNRDDSSIRAAGLGTSRLTALGLWERHNRMVSAQLDRSLTLLDFRTCFIVVLSYPWNLERSLKH
jgi:hypothetical protein